MTLNRGVSNKFIEFKIVNTQNIVFLSNQFVFSRQNVKTRSLVKRINSKKKNRKLCIVVDIKPRPKNMYSSVENMIFNFSHIGTLTHINLFVC